MQEHMKESITTEFADVCIRVPAKEVDRVKSAFSKFLELAGVQYSIPSEEEDSPVAKSGSSLRSREIFSRGPETVRKSPRPNSQRELE